jgi:hypothetical protein
MQEGEDRILVQDTKSAMKKVPYGNLSKKPFLQRMKDALPEGAQATDLAPKIFAAIFALVIIAGAIQFPYQGVLSGNLDVSSKIGYPLVFLEFKLNEPNTNPVNVMAMLVDLFLYMLLAYGIDIGINILKHSELFKSREELKGIPKQYPMKR